MSYPQVYKYTSNISSKTHSLYTAKLSSSLQSVLQAEYTVLKQRRTWKLDLNKHREFALQVGMALQAASLVSSAFVFPKEVRC
jgi:hypothetical protein